MPSATEEDLRRQVEELLGRVQSLESKLAAQQNGMSGKEDTGEHSKSPTHVWEPQHSTKPKGRTLGQSASLVARLNGMNVSEGQEISVSMTASRAVTNHIVLTSESNHLGVCEGGQVLCWIDVCAGLAAKRLARSPCVTASVDAVQFLRPCRVGSVVLVAATVNRTFNSSMEIGVRVEEEDPATGRRHHCCSAYLTFVNLERRKPDSTATPASFATSGRPRKLPRVVPTTPHQVEVYHAALQRREERLMRKKEFKDRNCEETYRLLPVSHSEHCSAIPPPLVTPWCSANVGGSKPALRPSMTVSHVTQSIMPQHANSIGITFGGQVMRWMEQCAFISGSRVSRSTLLLTASMDSIDFANPTKVGDVLYVTAQVTAIFGSSLEVMIVVHGENPVEGVLFDCATAFATLVCVDQQGNPRDVPFDLQPGTIAEKRRLEDAIVRRENRLRLRQSLLDQRSARVSIDGPPGLPCSQDVMLPILQHDARRGDSSSAGSADIAGTAGSLLALPVSSQLPTTAPPELSNLLGRRSIREIRQGDPAGDMDLLASANGVGHVTARTSVGEIRQGDPVGDSDLLASANGVGHVMARGSVGEIGQGDQGGREVGRQAPTTIGAAGPLSPRRLSEVSRVFVDAKPV